MMLLPLPTITLPLLQRRRPLEGLTVLRILWLSFFTALVLFLVVLVIIEPDVGSPDDPYLLLLIPAQLGALGVVLWARRKPLDVSSEETLAGTYQGSPLSLGRALLSTPEGR
jgi:hypothetical protein